jgi:pimeloyl-ACP methyl ester carboxylesterase
VSTPTSLTLPDGVRRTVIETSRGAFAALEAIPGSGVCELQPAILVPGFTGSKEDFLAILQQLAAARRWVLALDLRGQYETRGPDDPEAYTIAELGFDIAAVIDAVAGRATGHGSAALGIHLVGHSFGGLVVRESVLAGASGIASLTLMSSGPGRLTGLAAAELAQLTRSLDNGSPEVMRRTIRHLWDTILAPQATAAGIAPEIVAFLRNRMLRNSPVGLRVTGEYLLSAPDRTAELAELADMPILVLYGEDDDKWEPTAQEEMAARLDAERVCIPAAAHSPAVDAPETTASALSGFWHMAEAIADERDRTASRAARRRLFGDAVPRAAVGAGRGANGAVLPVVTPATARPRTRREHLVVLRGGQAAAKGRVGLAALRRDVLGPAQLPRQRLVRVLPAEHAPGGQMVQLDPVARAPQRPGRGHCVDSQRERAAGAVGGEQVTAGLVVHHDELGARVLRGPLIQPVDAPRHGDAVGTGRDRPLHAPRLVRGVQRRDVRLDHRAGARSLPGGLLLVREAQADPSCLQELAGGGHAAAGQR